MVSHAPYSQVLASTEMPGAEWFPGAQLNYAEHALGRPEDADRVAVLGRSQTRPDVDLTFAELRDQVARARTLLAELGVSRGDRVVGYVPNVPEALVAFLATASLGATWASCATEFGARSVIDRFAQVEPVVLLVAGGYRYGAKDVDRTEQVREIRAGLPTVRHVLDLEYGEWRVDDAESWPDLLRAVENPTLTSSRCRSTIRWWCCSPRVRRASRRRSSTATAGSCSSTSRTTRSRGTSGPRTGCCGSARPPG